MGRVAKGALFPVWADPKAVELFDLIRSNVQRDAPGNVRFCSTAIQFFDTDGAV